MAAKASATILPRLLLTRAEREMTQNDLADRAGVARGTIIRAETGGSVSILSAVRIAKALGVPVGDLQGPKASPSGDRNA